MLDSSSDRRRVLQSTAQRLSGVESDFDPLIDLTGEAPFVLLGEASHGTHEFYSTRAEITRRLIREKGFQAVAVEADWPDAYHVNRYVRGRSEDTRAAQALAGFTRFPVWMWRNRDVEAFSVTLKGDDRLATEFSTGRLERAIGVIYRPETERISHYFMARLADQFDAVLHFDETSAVEPLPHSEEDERQMSELPETYPTGV